MKYMEVVHLLTILLDIVSVLSFSMVDVCDDADIKCKYPLMSEPGEIIYGRCHRDVTLRRLQRASFLTCLKECMRTANCTNIGYRRNWKLCDINGDPKPKQNLVQEDGCLFSNVSSWSKVSYIFSSTKKRSRENDLVFDYREVPWSV